MIIGFLGKGGSGKSTVSSLFAQLLCSQKQSVLAIDADYNMDMTYNLLGSTPHPKLFGSSLSYLKAIHHFSPETDYREFFTKENHPHFSLSPMDQYTKEYSVRTSSGIHLMTAGSYTDDILHDKTCSHSLSTPLKVYLPFLSLNTNEWVVVDEKAGADAVTTGIPSGFDVAVVVVEPRPQSISVAQNISKLLSFYGTPIHYIGNKISNTAEKETIENGLKSKLSAIVPVHSEYTNEVAQYLLPLLNALTSNFISVSRKERSILKVKRNKEYTHN